MASPKDIDQPLDLRGADVEGPIESERELMGYQEWDVGIRRIMGWAHPPSLRGDRRDAEAVPLPHAGFQVGNWGYVGSWPGQARPKGRAHQQGGC